MEKRESLALTGIIVKAMEEKKAEKQKENGEKHPVSLRRSFTRSTLLWITFRDARQIQSTSYDP